MLTALEVKTSYSILSSLNRIDKLTEKASELGYFSLCITDTNNMFGVYEFYLSCKKNNIKPIIGMTVVNKQDKFILIAKNNDGYKNLIKLSTIISERELEIEDLTKYWLYSETLDSRSADGGNNSIALIISASPFAYFSSNINSLPRFK